MKVLVVGGGGREHALCWGLARSPLVTEVIAAPGNAGIARVASCMPVATNDLEGIARLAADLDVDLVVVGPEVPLVDGLADLLRKKGRAVFGPGRAAAMIEGSKAWSKALMQRAGIPTARAQAFTALEPAMSFVDDLGGRAVVKADGLAAGKGVTVAKDRDGARSALESCLHDAAFGSAGYTVVVEEILEGEEVSAFALADGVTLAPLALSRDYKRIGDSDVGPNTGGMGAVSPVYLDPGVEDSIWGLARRSVEALMAEGITYTGLLYLGIMLTPAGPKVLEYNCRFGDPETQAVIPRLRSDLAELLTACATGSLSGTRVELTDESAVTVVLASGGYPGGYSTGLEISGLEGAERDGAVVFHSGTALMDGRVVTAGGRVLAVSATGATRAASRDLAYGACARISFQGKTMRSDIGKEEGDR
jgi:phosphoribosylamine---glycine ligase